MQLNSEKLYMPYNPKTGAVGYAVSPTQRETRALFCDLMGGDWQNLRRAGWRILPVAIGWAVDATS